MSNDILNDGSIRQDGLTFNKRDTSGQGEMRINYPVLAQVLAVYETDDEQNRDGDAVIADLHIMEMGITLQKVPVCLPCGGADNYMHLPIHAATRNVDDSKFNLLINEPKLTDGDVAMVIFPMGNIHRPHIIAFYPHYQSGKNGKSPSKRPGKTDKKAFKLRINGTNFIIDKDGNVIFESTDVLDKKAGIPRNKKFFFNIDNGAGGHLIVFDMTPGAEEISFTHKQGSMVKMDKDGSILIADKSGNFVFLDAINFVATVASKTGSLITLKDDIVIADKTGANIINLKDDTVQITGGQNVVISSPSCTIESGTVNIGTAAIFHATVYENLKTVFDAHTHATAVGPSGPPLPPNTLALTEASPATSAKAEYVLLRANL